MILEGKKSVSNVIPEASSINQIMNSIITIQNLNHSEMMKYLRYQEKTIGTTFTKLRTFLKYRSLKKIGLVDDQIYSRDQWHYYYTYQSLIEFWRKRLLGLIKSLMNKTQEEIPEFVNVKGEKRSFDRKRILTL